MSKDSPPPQPNRVKSSKMDSELNTNLWAEVSDQTKARFGVPSGDEFAPIDLTTINPNEQQNPADIPTDILQSLLEPARKVKTEEQQDSKAKAYPNTVKSSIIDEEFNLDLWSSVSNKTKERFGIPKEEELEPIDIKTPKQKPSADYVTSDFLEPLLNIEPDNATGNNNAPSLANKQNAMMQVKQALDDARLISSHGLSKRQWTSDKKPSPEFAKKYDELLTNEGQRTGEPKSKINDRLKASKAIVGELFRSAEDIANNTPRSQVEEEAKQIPEWTAPNSKFEQTFKIAARRVTDEIATKLEQGQTQSDTNNPTETSIRYNFRDSVTSGVSPSGIRLAQSPISVPKESERMYEYIHSQRKALAADDRQNQHLNSEGVPYVLLGRGSGSNDAIGNIAFRKECEKHKESYQSTNNRSDKHRITEQVIDTLIENKIIAGFKEKTEEDQWRILDMESKPDLDKIHGKTKQCLRQNNKEPSLQKRKRDEDGSTPEFLKKIKAEKDSKQANPGENSNCPEYWRAKVKNSGQKERVLD